MPALISLCLAALLTQDAAVQAPATYLRLIEEGSELRLELAEREFAKPLLEGQKPGPRIVLVAAMHVAEREFYQALQTRLDTLDLVLFEGVSPAPLTLDVEGLEQSPARFAHLATRRCLRAAAILLARHRAEHGQYPSQLAELGAAAANTPHGFKALQDAWGRSLLYELHPAAEEGAEATFSLISLGADGQAGGEGAARDLLFKDQRPIEAHETGGRKGIQQDLASALALTFQLDAMSDLSGHWRNTDASLEQVSSWLAESDSSFSLDSLSGESLTARLMGGMMRLVGLSETLSGLLRLVGIEVLAASEQLMQRPPQEFGPTLSILLERRNGIVLEALQEILEGKGGEQSVGIIYGAAHQGAFQAALEQAGFTLVTETWRPAARVDLDDLALPRAQVDWTRKMLRRELAKLKR